jgi:hypothetical protein
MAEHSAGRAIISAEVRFLPDCTLGQVGQHVTIGILKAMDHQIDTQRARQQSTAHTMKIM